MATVARGQTHSSWLSPSSGNWIDPANWSSNPDYPNNGSPPGATYDVTIGAAGPAYTVSLSDSVAVSTLSIAGTGKVTQGGGTLMISAQLALANTTSAASGQYELDGGMLLINGSAGGAPNVVVGAAGNGTFTQSAGTVSVSGGVTVGELAGSAGTYNLSAGSVQEASCVVGQLGAGTFLQSGGFHSNVGPLHVGRDAGSSGFYQLSGDAFLISNGSGQVNVGSAGFGTFVQTGGIHSTGVGGLFIARNALARGRYTLSGGTLSSGFESIASAGSGTFEQTGGFHAVGSTLTNQNNGTGIYIMSGGTLNVGQLQNKGTFIQSGGVASFGVMFGTGTIAVADSARLSAITIRTGTLSIAAGAQITARPNNGFSTLSSASTFTIAGAALPVGTLDLTVNDLQIANGDVALLRSQIAYARNAGAWNRAGITSASAAAAVVKNTALGILTGTEYLAVSGGTFDGIAVNATDSLIKYTYYGDTDLNGTVNFDDYSRIDAGFLNARTGWLNGDFDYNGLVNFDDYSLIDLAFNTQSGTLRRTMTYLDGGDRSDEGMNAPALRLVQEHFAQFGEGFAWSFLNAVPEPTSALILGGIGAAIFRHRRRAR